VTVSAFDHKAFSERLVSLDIRSDELAAIVAADAATIDKWRAGRARPSADERVKLRFLASDAAAIAAVERIRHTITLPREGEGAAHSGVTPPYAGGYEGHDRTAVPTVPPLPAPTPTTLEDVQDGQHYKDQGASR
jgi:hypothetical protein